ncbi:hypothetical protein IFO70_21255 [Phormidium tenue FACHB-886]|nr:hypothetical protein [Phormidium tenue FACHB-886]
MSLDAKLNIFKSCAIASRSHLFECVECAATIQQFLISHSVPGQLIRLSTGSTGEPFCNIYHERLQENISTHFSNQHQ